MNRYLVELTSLISNCKMDNTYKMSWARAITEYLVTHDKAQSIHLDELSPLIFKYYWNQIIFFGLNQSPNPSNPPIICQIVKNEIDKQKMNSINKYLPFSLKAQRIMPLFIIFKLLTFSGFVAYMMNR